MVFTTQKKILLYSILLLTWNWSFLLSKFSRKLLMILKIHSWTSLEQVFTLFEKKSLKMYNTCTCTRRMFMNIGKFACKIKTSHCLNNRTKQARTLYCTSRLLMVYDNSQFHSNVWFSDEIHIHLNAFNQTGRRQVFLNFSAKADQLKNHKIVSTKSYIVQCTLSARGILSLILLRWYEWSCYCKSIRLQKENHSTISRFYCARNLAFNCQWFQHLNNCVCSG